MVNKLIIQYYSISDYLLEYWKQYIENGKIPEIFTEEEWSNYLFRHSKQSNLTLCAMNEIKCDTKMYFFGSLSDLETEVEWELTCNNYIVVGYYGLVLADFDFRYNYVKIECN